MNPFSEVGDVATHLVNLDALIPREDFAVSDNRRSEQDSAGYELRLNELAGNYYRLIRKPDFQRETANWDPAKIAGFIKSLVDGDLIPAPIMWWSDDSALDFVIDGAHRLSAILAWIHDDYGDGLISQEFFGRKIPAKQITFAKETRDLVRESVGSYVDLMTVVERGSSDEELLKRGRRVVAARFSVQRVRGNAEAAENSFFRINTGAIPIDPAELGVLQARRKPNAIATRALMRSGTGHKYWKKFGKPVGDEIERLSKEINELLFTPILDDEARSSDWPAAGQPYSHSAFTMMLDLVNTVNGITDSMWMPPERGKRRRAADRVVPEDEDGSATVRLLKRVRKEASWVSGDRRRSLGLFPLVYFYDSKGKFRPVAYLATIQFVRRLREQRRLGVFITHRRDFEEFLLRHRHFISQLTHSKGSRTRPFGSLITLYETVLEALETGTRHDAEIVTLLRSKKSLENLKDEAELRETKSRKFSTEAKLIVRIEAQLQHVVPCDICGARLALREMSIDHKQRMQDGGRGNLANAQRTHPYCNTGYKERLAHLERKGRAVMADPVLPFP